MFARLFITCLLSLCQLLPSVVAEAAWPYQTFNTTDAQVPVVQVSKFGKTEAGYLFLTPNNAVAGEVASAIFTDDGDLVWHSDLGTMNLRVQQLHGQPVMTNWNGIMFNEGLGWGTVSIFDQSYALIKNVTLEEHFQTMNHSKASSFMDFHEAQMTDDNTLLVTANNITRADMSAVGGPKDGWVIDSLFYEIDVATNEVRFRWSAVEHADEVPLKDSLLPLQSSISGDGSSYDQPWGYFHMNSVAKYGSNYLMSSRLLCTIFYIDSKGHVSWRISGKTGGDFNLGPDTNFCYQHFTRIPYMTETGLTLTMHDNGDTEYDNHTVTRGLSLDLDFQTQTATLNRSLSNPNGPVYAVSQGSYQDLPERHVLLGHGAVPIVEEYDADDNLNLLFRWAVNYNLESYRAFRSAWTGKPTTRPAVSAFASNGATDIYMSWNGATEVETWNIYTGSSPSSMQMLISVARDGFETGISVPGMLTNVQVEAVYFDGTKTKSSMAQVKLLS